MVFGLGGWYVFQFFFLSPVVFPFYRLVSLFRAGFWESSDWDGGMYLGEE